MASIVKNWPAVCRDLNTLTMCPPIIVVLASGRMIAGFFQLMINCRTCLLNPVRLDTQSVNARARIGESNLQRPGRVSARLMIDDDQRFIIPDAVNIALSHETQSQRRSWLHDQFAGRADDSERFFDCLDIGTFDLITGRIRSQCMPGRHPDTGLRFLIKV